MAKKDAYGITQPDVGEWRGEKLCRRYIADYKPFNFVDGEGVRCSLYVSGCPFKCPDATMPPRRVFVTYRQYTAELEEQIISDLAQPYVAGLSLLGGEPFLSTPILLPLVRKVRKRFGKENRMDLVRVSV